jgi:polysaccharide deacetylase 2 family uncharacterized protein YibQ
MEISQPVSVTMQIAAAEDEHSHQHEAKKPPIKVSRQKIYGNIETEPMIGTLVPVSKRRDFSKLEFIGPDQEPERNARPGQGKPFTPSRHRVREPESREALDRQQPWLRFAAAAPTDTSLPMVALVLDDVGLSHFRSEAVISLHGPVTVALLPYGRGLSKLTARARAAGHEVMVHLPMEPRDRDADPGPNALFVDLDDGELRRRLEWNLRQFDSYVGVSNHMGSRFTASREPMERIMRIIKDRGLLYLDSVTSERSVGLRTALRMGVPAVSRDLFIDAKRDRAFIRRQLATAEQIARKTGFVVAIGHPYPETLEELSKWLPGLRAKGLQQVPVSAIVLRKRTG